MNKASPSSAQIAASQISEALAHHEQIDISPALPERPISGWALDLKTLKFLVGIVRQTRPRHIVEFGSGLSTQILAWATSQMNPPPSITSIEHDPVFAELTLTNLDAKDDRVKCLFAPLVARKADEHRPMYHFDRTKFASPFDADLFLVDGPPESLGERSGMLFQIMQFARSGAIVLINDADRKQESAALDLWKDIYGPAIEVQRLPGFKKGLAAVIIDTPISLEAMRHHRLGLMHAQLDSQFPRGTSVILADQGLFEIDKLPGTVTWLPLWQDPGMPVTPVDSTQAIAAIDRCVHAGTRHLVFAWPAFWWADYFPELRNYLDTAWQLLVHCSNANLRTYRLRCDD